LTTDSEILYNLPFSVLVSLALCFKTFTVVIYE
jgi:hypothetical protein